jgi:diguanylate cyclase (GGDEF)-like protein
MDPSPLGHPALTDDLTGLPNRLHFDAVYRVVFRAVNRGIPVSVAVMQVDGFEEAGQERGLGMVRTVGERLRRTVRGADLLARVGEGRFYLLLFDCNPQGGRIAADRYQEQLTADGITLSVGVASVARGEEPRDPGDLIATAEEALERALSLGGGEVEVAVPTR